MKNKIQLSNSAVNFNKNLRLNIQDICTKNPQFKTKGINKIHAQTYIYQQYSIQR